jgi:hypothetical protein
METGVSRVLCEKPFYLSQRPQRDKNAENKFILLNFLPLRPLREILCLAKTAKSAKKSLLRHPTVPPLF